MLEFALEKNGHVGAAHVLVRNPEALQLGDHPSHRRIHFLDGLIRRRRADFDPQVGARDVRGASRFADARHRDAAHGRTGGRAFYDGLGGGAAERPCAEQYGEREDTYICRHATSW